MDVNRVLKCPVTLSKRGFSLVEVMVATVIFAFISLGLIYSILQSRRQSENLVYDNVSLSLAQGYIEQMRALGYYDLLNASKSTTYELETKSVGVTSGVLGIKSDTINVGVVNKRDILVDIDEGTGGAVSGKTMYIEFLPTVTSITSASGVEAMLIKLSYTYTLDSVGGTGTRTKSHELRSLVARID